MPAKRHWTRDLAVSRDGQRLFVSIGSASNVAAMMPKKTCEQIQAHEKRHGLGAARGEEENRAVVRVVDPQGKTVRNFATGLRNCSGMALQPGTDTLWCMGNARDHLGPKSGTRFPDRDPGRRVLRLALVHHRRQRPPPTPACAPISRTRSRARKK
jgi:glucose/arabinose dehydrogenase